MPLLLSAEPDESQGVKPTAGGSDQAQGQDLAVFTVESKWTPNKPLEAKHCYGTTSIEHPAVSMITTERGKYYLGARPARGDSYGGLNCSAEVTEAHGC